MKRLLTPVNGTAGPLVFALSGGACGIMSWCLVFPLDTAKSIVQRDLLSKPPGYKPRKLASLKWSTLYRGVSVSITRSAIVNCISFVVYESGKLHLNKGASLE